MLLALKPLMLWELPSYSSTLSSNSLDYMRLSSPTKALSSLPPSLRNSLVSSSMMFASPLPTILRPMDKLSEPIRSSKLIFASFVPTTRLNGYSSFPQQNSITTLPLIAPLRRPHSPCFTTMNLTLTPLWERPSSPPFRNDCPNSMKPKKKLLQPMTPPKNS